MLLREDGQLWSETSCFPASPRAGLGIVAKHPGNGLFLLLDFYYISRKHVGTLGLVFSVHQFVEED